MENEAKKEVEILKNRLLQLEQTVSKLNKETIKITGNLDSSLNIPITANGIRRKIATSAP